MVSSLLAVASDKEEWVLASEDCATDANTFPIMNVTERFDFCWDRTDDYSDSRFLDHYFDNGTIVHFDTVACVIDLPTDSRSLFPHSAPTREAMGNCVFDDREFVTMLEDYTPEMDPILPLKKGMRGVVVAPYDRLRGVQIKVEGEGIFPEQYLTPVYDRHGKAHNISVVDIERGSRVDCSVSVPARFQECCQSGKKFCYPARVDALECATCTAEWQNPWSKGYEVPCCDGLQKVLRQSDACGHDSQTYSSKWCYSCQAPRQGDDASWDGEVIV